MQVTVEDKGGLSRQVNITIPATDVSKKLDERFEMLARSVKVDGFRPGKVPVKVVKQRHGEQVLAETAQYLVEESLPKALQENDLSIAGRPDVHAHDVKEGEDYSYHAHVEVYPKIEPKGFSGLKLTKEVAEAGDDLLKEALENLQKQLQQFEDKDGKAEDGDRVTLNGVGYADDVAFEGGNLQDFPVVIGSGSLIPGFEEGLVGLKAGDKKDLDVKFPKDYAAKELAGKPAVFKIEVTAIATPKAIELNDEEAKKLGFDSLDKLKDLLKQGAEKDLESATTQRLKRGLFDEMDKANTFDLPKNLVEAELDALFSTQIRDLQSRGLTLEALGKGVDEVRAELSEIAERRVKLGLLLAEIAKKEGIKVEDADIKKAVEEQIKAAGPQAEQAKQYFANPQNLQNLIGPMLEEKVVTWVLEQSEVKEKKVDAKKLLEELQ